MSLLSRIFGTKKSGPPATLNLCDVRDDGSSVDFRPDDIVPSPGHERLAFSCFLHDDILVVDTASRQTCARIATQDDGTERHMFWLNADTLVYCEGSPTSMAEEDRSWNTTVKAWSHAQNKTLWALALSEHGVIEVEAMSALPDGKTIVLSGIRFGENRSVMVFVDAQLGQVVSIEMPEDAILSVEQLVRLPRRGAGTFEDAELLAAGKTMDERVYIARFLPQGRDTQMLQILQDDVSIESEIVLRTHAPSRRLALAYTIRDKEGLHRAMRVRVFTRLDDGLALVHDVPMLNDCDTLEGFLDADHLVISAPDDDMHCMRSVFRPEPEARFAFAPMNLAFTEQFTAWQDNIWAVDGHTLSVTPVHAALEPPPPGTSRRPSATRSLSV